MPDLSSQKKAQRVRIYISESDRWRGNPLDAVLLEKIRDLDMAGATVFRGIAGFGAHSHIRTTRIEVLSFDLPVIIEVVDIPGKISSLLDVVYPMVREGLITVDEIQIIKYTHRFLNPLPADRLVSEVMTQNVVSISKDATIHDTWKLMLKKKVKAMPVIDQDEKVIGIITNEDLFERAGIQQRLSVAIRMEDADINQELKRLESAPQKVKTVMTHPVVTVFGTEILGVATSKMVKAGLKRLPVTDADGRLIGMLSRLDILRQVAQIHQIAPAEEKILPQAVRLVQDIMTTEIPMVNQDEGLAAVIDKFASSNSHRLIVTDSKGKAIGLISDSDVVAHVQPAKRKNILDSLRQIGKPAPGKETASELMSTGPLTARPDLPVVDAIKMMLAESRKWLVVIDEKGKPLGLVNRELLLETLASPYHGNN